MFMNVIISTPSINMYKIFLLLILVLFGACSTPNPDFLALEDELMHSTSEVIGNGFADNVFVKIPATDKIKDIAMHNKNTVFWSGLESGDIIAHVSKDTCLVDAKIDYVGNCPYRLYCGGAVELMIAISVNAPYATEICK